MTTRWTRRDLLKTAATTAAGLALPEWFVERQAGRADARETSPNERPKVALIGCGNRGTVDAKAAQKFADVVAVCDVDASHVEKARATFKGAKGYHDYRQVCDSKDVDAVVNGTPDHWHTLINLRALRSGKDVYSEKPLTLTIDEGRRLVATVQQTGRVFQTGSQQRSDPRFRLACELVRNGRIGKVERVRVWLPMGLHGGPFPTQPVPEGLDWDTWQGQAPATAYVPERCHSNFRYWWDYSGGTMTDWGAHHNDIALWGLGKERSGPRTIEGRRLDEPVPGGYTAASRYEVRYAYDDGIEQLVRTTANGRSGQVVGPLEPGQKHHGVQFEGPNGWIYVTRGKIDASDPALLTEPLPSDAVRLYKSDDHMGNFVECLKTRKAPICEAEIGHRSVSVCHLGVIAIRLGRKLQWDPHAEQFVNDADANTYVAREQRKPYTYEQA